MKIIERDGKAEMFGVDIKAVVLWSIYGLFVLCISVMGLNYDSPKFNTITSKLTFGFIIAVCILLFLYMFLLSFIKFQVTSDRFSCQWLGYSWEQTGKLALKAIPVRGGTYSLYIYFAKGAMTIPFMRKNDLLAFVEIIKRNYQHTVEFHMRDFGDAGG
ncbi:hypothetical protein ACLVWU_08655 [Bdellovibrio sp. HCB290]|uniref:hypothetical protein n=1 Tax=Bdellovibrio sp. HCB290 TaxID=3394356 RepID=UPI0039B6E693